MSATDKKTKEQLDAELKETVAAILQLVKENGEVTLKLIKENHVPKDLQSKISERLKTHDKLAFRLQGKEVYFSYDENAKKKKDEDVQKITQLLMDAIDADPKGEVRVSPFIDKNKLNRWQFNHTIKILKKQRRVQTRKDYESTFVSKYLNQEDADILASIRKQLTNTPVAQISMLKKDTQKEFPTCQTRTLTRIIKLLIEDTENPLGRGKIGQTEYVFYPASKEQFSNMEAEFKEDVETVVEAVGDGTDPVELDGLQSRIKTPVSQILKYLNFQGCGKQYVIRTNKESKKKYVQKEDDEKQKQTTVIEAFIHRLANKERKFLKREISQLKSLLI